METERESPGFKSKPMSRKPPTVSDILRSVRTPVFDVYKSPLKGDIVVQVSGVPSPFEVQITEQTLRDDAPFGRITDRNTMRTAHRIAQIECIDRGLI